MPMGKITENKKKVTICLWERADVPPEHWLLLKTFSNAVVCVKNGGAASGW